MTESADQPEAEDLERLLLGAARRFTGEQVAQAADVPLETAQEYWRALGFPSAGDQAAFTVWDLEALRGVIELVKAGTLDENTAIQMVRALGRMTGRLAEWHVETIAEQIEESEEVREDGKSRLTAAHQAAQRLLPEFERLLIYAWRRKLAASVGRLVATGDLGKSSLLSTSASVGFADIVSFTRMSRGLTVEALGELVEQFEATTNDVIFGSGGRVVKTLGDEVMFVADSAADAALIGCRLVDKIGDDASLPDIRVGIATGQVIARLGDVFGNPTNLAARLTAVAGRNTVVVDHATAEALSDETSLVVRALPPQDVRGYGPVSPFRVSQRH